MSAMEALDKLDRAILRSLQADGRATYDQVAETVGLSASAVLRRVRRLEESGVIARYVALLRPEAVGLGLTAHVSVRLEKHAEDFGQTLGKWGVGEGPYLFWPIIGPRNVRDTFGFAVDASADPVVHLHDVSARNTLIGIRFIDLRASLLPADKVIEEAAFDKYNYIRDAYFQNRRNAVHDGKPPPLKEED